MSTKQQKSLEQIMTLNDVVVISLREARISHPEVYQTVLKSFSKMKKETDGEDGEPFIRWIESNISLQDLNYDTYALLEKNTENVLGSISVLPDDQDVGRIHNIQGVWIGGAWVPEKCRNKKIFHILIKCAENKLRETVNEKQIPVQINFYTQNPRSKHMGDLYGFKFTGSFYVPYFKQNEDFYVKMIEPEKE